MTMKKKSKAGYLVPIGGAEDRLNEKKVLPAVVDRPNRPGEYPSA